MIIGFDFGTLLTGMVIFLARIADVTLGTMRTISIVHGRTRTSFFLGFVEVSIWLAVISAVVNKIMDKPILGVFYAIGFSAGNVVGIMLERRIGLGHTILHVITTQNGLGMAKKIRESGYAVTTFPGEGMYGPVTGLYIACRRRDLTDIVRMIRGIEPEAFYITEQAGSVSKIYHPFMHYATGWRTVFKRK